MVQAFFDESYDDGHRVFTIAGFLAHQDEWTRLAERWKARCSQDSISCYHATDCAGGWNEFSGLSEERRIALNTDLITYMAETKLVGFGVSISYQDYAEVSRSSATAKSVLGSDPYYLGMQLLVLQVCSVISKEYPDYDLAFVFDQNEKVSGQAKVVWDEVRKKNTDLAHCMGSLSYFDKKKSVPLQAADELAFEAMKNALNWLDGRGDRKPISRMKEAKILHRLDFLNRAGLEQTVRQQSGTRG